MARHHKGCWLHHLQTYPACPGFDDTYAYRQRRRVGLGPGRAASSSPSLPGQGKALSQLWECGVEVRSSGAGWCWPWQRCALLAVPVLSNCRTGLPPDAKANAPPQGNEAVTRDGVQAISEEVRFGRGNLTLKIFYMIQIKPKYFSPLLMLDKAHP